MSIDINQLQKDLKFCKNVMWISFFFAIFFCAGFIIESESFLWITWDNTDEIKDRLIQQGRAEMFMEIYPTPSTVILMLDKGYLQWETVPNNLKPLIDCGYIEKVMDGNMTNVDCYSGGIEEQ